MKIKEWIRDPFGEKLARRERERIEGIAEKNVRGFLEEVPNPCLQVHLPPPKISFVYGTPDYMLPEDFRDTQYEEGEISVNWTTMRTVTPHRIRQNYLLFALVATGHELGHYIQDKLHLAWHKETYGLLDRDLGKKIKRRLRATAEDQGDYIAGIFIRYLINKKELVLSEEECVTLSKNHEEIGTRFFDRDGGGHGSRSHRRDLFASGLYAKNIEEEVKLVFRE